LWRETGRSPTPHHGTTGEVHWTACDTPICEDARDTAARIRAFTDALLAAARAEGAAQVPAGLDVERLARAMERAYGHGQPLLTTADGYLGGRTTISGWDAAAARVAAAYREDEKKENP
jgi:hypothetical protein